MLIEGHCAACGRALRKKYAADRVPSVMFCDAACRAAHASTSRGVVASTCGNLCVAPVQSCVRTGKDFIGVGHGVAGYAGGCRCQICRSAHATGCRRRRLKHYIKRAAGETDDVEHGTASTYVNKGCRCDACRAAKSVAIRLYRETGTQRTA